MFGAGGAAVQEGQMEVRGVEGEGEPMGTGGSCQG